MAKFQLGDVFGAISMAVLPQADSFCQNNAEDDGPSLLLCLVSGTCGLLALTPGQQLSRQPHMVHHKVNPSSTKVLAEGHPTYFAKVCWFFFLMY